MHGNFLTRDRYPNFDLPFFTSDERFIKVDIWSFILFAKNWDFVERNLEESLVFLKNNDREQRVLSVKENAPLVLKNNFPFQVSNVTVYSLSNNKEVFFWKEIAPEKRLRLTFLKEGLYNLHFNFPELEDSKEGYLKIKIISRTLSPAYK